MSAELLRFFSLITLTCLWVWADDTRATDTRPVATVNGKSITSAQLEAVVRKQVEAFEGRLQQLRQSVLNKLIDNMLLEQAARAEGINVDDYLKRHIESIGVSGTEVDAAYERSRDQFPGVLPAEAKYRIRRTLEDNRRAAALNDLLDGLRRQGQVTNHLIEDRSAVLDFAAQEGPALGDAGAPVTIIEFLDFECPYCRAAQPAIKQILRRWPGRVRVVFRHFPLDQHANAMMAARAAVCADSQGRFWAVHDRIFAMTEPLSDTALLSAATGAGADPRRLEACMATEETGERVRKDIVLARKVGVSGTPAFFVNRQSVASAAELEMAVARILGGAR